MHMSPCTYWLNSPLQPFIFHVEEEHSVEVLSCRGSSQWINGNVDYRSRSDDNNTGEVEEREGEEVLSVACSTK